MVVQNYTRKVAHERVKSMNLSYNFAETVHVFTPS